ncbi:hypothetical protein C9I98_03135 [Photobacterium sanctipauli]|uniref:SSD domain-containing protein n=1 Tax=Photobacterium sanctipauli TaxID=1342794 RepID=A0A2T3P162_9GAMM|nr:MMPL family transporter [Photobacterium sanctipauli]PSW22271.1 hypothetical protein C9I98_03135 [Photobacterium sanctipauli]
MSKTFIDKLLDKSWSRPLLFISLVLAAIAGVGLSKLGLATDYKIFFDDDSRDLAVLEQMEAEYTASDNVFIMVKAPEDIYTPTSLSLLHGLTETLWTLPHVSRVNSLTNYPYSSAIEDDIVIDNFIYEPTQITPEFARWIAQIAPKEKNLFGSLINDDPSYAGINITVQLPGLSPQEEILAVSNTVDTLLESWRADYPDYRFYATGVVAMNSAFIKAAKKDFITLIPLMIVVILVMSAIILGSFKASLSILVLMLLTFAGALGSAGWLGIQLSAPSISAPIIMFTVIVASTIHIINAVKRGLIQGLAQHQAVTTAYQQHGRPILVSHLTTIAGFLAMNVSDSPPFRDLGNIVALGVAFSLLLCFFVLPTLLLTLRFNKHSGKVAGVMARVTALAKWVILYQARIRRWMVPAAILFAATGLLNQPNDDLVKYFSKDVPFRTETETIDRQFSAIYNIGYAFDSGKDNGVFEPRFLRFIEQFTAWLSQQPEVTVTDSPLFRIKDLNQLLNGDLPEYYAIPATAELAAQYFLLYEMSLPFGQDITHQLTFNKSALKLTARLTNMSSVEVINFEQRAAEWLDIHAPAFVHYQYSSPALIFAHIGQSNVISLLEGAFIAFIVITLTMTSLFRSAYIGALTLLPNLLPIGAAFGCWYWLNGQISMGLAGVTAMAIGIIVDDTVHFLHQYINGLKRGLTPEQSITHTFETTMSAIVISSLLLVIGFLLLASSSFEKNAQMGLLTGLTILLALIFDLLVLPAIVLKYLRQLPMKKRISKTETTRSITHSNT